MPRPLNNPLTIHVVGVLLVMATIAPRARGADDPVPARSASAAPSAASEPRLILQAPVVGTALRPGTNGESLAPGAVLGFPDDCNGNAVPDELELDTDGDQTIDDCEDCPYEPALTEPTEPGQELTCDDRIDNDCDGLTDPLDADCPPPGCTCGDIGGYGGEIDLGHFATLANCFNLSRPSGSCRPNEFYCADLNQDGFVDLDDFSTFAILFQTPPTTNTPPNCLP